MSENKDAWLRKSEIDYFAPFISLWLACNAWYRGQYSDLSGTDKIFINKIKTDTSGRNHLYVHLKKTWNGNQTRNDIAFKANLEMLHHSLNRATIKPEKLEYPCSFNHLLIDHNDRSDPSKYTDIIKNPRILANGDVSSNDEGLVYKLDQIYITSDFDMVFSGLFELVYQIRNMVIHGDVLPNKDEHEVVKYCYLLLHDMMVKK